LLFAGPLWLAPFWFLLLWPYLHNGERALAVFFFIVFAFAYPAYYRIGQTSAATMDSRISPYMVALGEGPSVKAISDFEKYDRSHAKDPDSSIMLSSLYASDNQTDRAVRLLQKHILEYPSDSRAYNNLAAIFFEQEEWESALKLTQKAYSLDSTNLIYVFNLSRTYRATFNFTEANRLLEAARSASPKLTSKLEETNQNKLVLALPDDKSVYRRIQEKNGSFFSLLKNPFTLLTLGMLSLAVLWNLSASRRRILARSCSKCGRAYCIKCQTNTKVSDYCIQCLHIFIKKDGVSPASRKEKMEEIGSFTRKQHTLSRISSLILPGANHLYHNQTFRGAVILLLWFFFLLVLLFNWKFTLTYFESQGSATVLNLLCVMGLAIIYVFANFNLLRTERS
jgi:tetratricopeptide (TPR) repeat protein